MRTPQHRLVGRATETEALLTALSGLPTSGGRAIAMVGEPGIGKSTLMFTATARARATGVPVLIVHGHSPLAPVQVAKVAKGVAAVVAVDDLHRLTVDRVPDIERLIHAAATGPVLCLLAYRQRQLSPALAAVLSRAASAGLLSVWNLAPLSGAETRELLGDRPDLDELHRESLGIPQYLQVAAGNDAGTAILGELADLDRGALTAVRAAAVLGRPFHPELLAAVAGLELAETLSALDTLAGLDLVRPIDPAPQLELRHRAVGEVIYQRLEPSRRLALHRSAESALADRAAPIDRRAHHVARAADPGRPEHASTLIAAARDMLHSSPAVAADHLQTALTLLKEDELHWHEAQVLLARARLLTGDASESRALLDALRDAAPGQGAHDRRAPASLADASRVERRLGHHTEAGAIARAGLAELADEDSATAAALHAELSDYAYDLRDFRTCRQHAETAATIARRHHDRVGEAGALAQASLGHLFTGDQSTAQSTATRAADLLDAVSNATVLTNLEALYLLGMTEGMLGRLDDAERHLTRGAALSRSTGQTFIEPVILMTLTNAQLRSGNLHRALATLDEASQHAEPAGNPATQAIFAMLRSEVLLWLSASDDPREVVAQADRAAAIADGRQTAWAVTVRCFHAELVLHLGDASRANWLLLDAAGGPDLPQLTDWRIPRSCDILAHAAQAQGDLDAVGRWARRAEESVEQMPSVGRRGFALRARMRAHALHGEIEQAVLSAREAFADFGAVGERIELCRTLLEAAALCLDAGRTADLNGWLDRAAALAHQCGSARLLDEVARRRARLIAQTGTAGTLVALDVLAVLTTREREIARLASTGMTSGEIADVLVLSVRTIDSHLGQVYRKLGVPNRASLTRALLSEAGYTK